MNKEELKDILCCTIESYKWREWNTNATTIPGMAGYPCTYIDENGKVWGLSIE